ncbi:MAG: M13-type metalloendopeptidase, partial [Tessaracoccus sp.]
GGVEEQRPRWKRGIAFVEGVMGEAIGKIYVERHFQPEAKIAMDILVANLLKAYENSIQKLSWMSEATRAEALDKLSKFRPKIGYPEQWRSFDDLTVTPGDLVASVLASNSFDADYSLSKVGGPVDPNEWLMYPQTVNAYYHPLRNEIVFPAAILQPPFFNPDADDAVNYGGIGSVIGHEIGHGFDDKGSTCDGDGRLRDWWTEEDREAFEELTAGLVKQFEVLSPEGTDGQKVNGELTLGENIGDLGGLSIAYEAWLLAGGDPDGEPIDGLTPAQRFFYGWAQVWRTKRRPENAKMLLAVDPHSPAEFRCNQIVRNLDAFHAAFGTENGDGLWLPEEERIVIW